MSHIFNRARRRMVMAKGTKYSQEFKEDAVRYRLFHDLVIMHGRSGFLRTRLFVELF